MIGNRKKKLDAYFRDGGTWEYETYLKLRRSAGLAWGAVAVSCTFTFLSLLALVLLVPLKEWAPYVITHDPSAGLIEVTQGLLPGDLTEDEAVTEANLVKCINAIETFDATDYRENVEYASQCLTGDDRARYRAQFADHENSHQNKYGHHTTVKVEIKSVSLLTDTTAHVRFQTRTRSGDRERVDHWLSAITFSYRQKPTVLSDRFENPLGFQIERYRRDQEILHD